MSLIILAYVRLSLEIDFGRRKFTMASLKLRLNVQGPAAVITLDNPPVNALNPSVSEEILGVLDASSGESAVRAVVITVAGRYFVAGGDIGFFPMLEPRPAEAYALANQAMQSALQSFDRPVSLPSMAMRWVADAS